MCLGVCLCPSPPYFHHISLFTAQHSVFIQRPQRNFVLINRPESFHWNISTLNILGEQILREYEPLQTATTWFTSLSPHKSIYIQFVQRLGVCFHIRKHILYFEDSVNVGKKKLKMSASLTFLKTLPQPASVMHAKCCLWVNAWGTASWSVWNRAISSEAGRPKQLLKKYSHKQAFGL